MTINYITKKIEMTETESKRAGKINTPEYNALLETMKNFPNYQVEIVKSAAKKADHLKGLDYTYMESYIKSHDESKLATFYELRGLDKDGKKIGMAASATYGEIKMWFLTQFPDIEKMADTINKIIEETRKARAAQKAAA